MSRITKSDERVRKHAEVFTPIHIVKKMVGLMEEENAGDDVWAIGKTWLEPSCGNGVFIGEIVQRKLAGHTDHNSCVAALKDVYAVDIMPDNVQQAQCQALGQFVMHCLKHGIPSDFGEAMMVVETNVICGDFLKPETIMVYDWNAHESVCLKSMMREEEPVKKPRKRRLKQSQDGVGL